MISMSGSAHAIKVVSQGSRFKGLSGTGVRKLVGRRPFVARVWLLEQSQGSREKGNGTSKGASGTVPPERQTATQTTQKRKE